MRSEWDDGNGKGGIMFAFGLGDIWMDQQGLYWNRLGSYTSGGYGMNFQVPRTRLDTAFMVFVYMHAWILFSVHMISTTQTRIQMKCLCET